MDPRTNVALDQILRMRGSFIIHKDKIKYPRGTQMRPILTSATLKSTRIDMRRTGVFYTGSCMNIIFQVTQLLETI